MNDILPYIKEKLLLIRDHTYITLGVITIILILGILCFGYKVYLSAPQSFPKKSVFIIESGESLDSISQKLYEAGYIKNAFLARNIIILLGGERSVAAGEYFFSRTQNVFGIAAKLIGADFGNKDIKVTIPEGLHREEIADLLSQKLPEFNRQDFLDLTKDKEGFLFPDTYYFQVQTREISIVGALEQNFARKIKPFERDIAQSGKSLEEIITFASLLEDEANDEESRRIVSGILYKRIEQDMPLQVDAPFRFLIGKRSDQLTKDDLKIDSPYNTYKYKGLPPGPINNPGLESIEAALDPIYTDYLYFLTDKEGRMHYSKTFEEHVKKKNLYLR